MRNPRNDTLGSPKTEADASPAKGSERRCVLTGQTSARDDLVRLAISPDGDVLPDALAKAPGRGAWIGVSKAELEEAIARAKPKHSLTADPSLFESSVFGLDQLDERLDEGVWVGLRLCEGLLGLLSRVHVLGEQCAHHVLIPLKIRHGVRV